MNQPPHHLLDDVLSAHADGALTGDEAAGAEEHLASCTECTGRLAQLEAARAAVHAPVAPVDDLTRQRLVRRALEVERRHARLVPRSPRWLAAAAAAAVALGTVSFLAVRDGGGDQLASQAASGGIGGLPLSEEFIATDAGAFDDPEFLRFTLEFAEDPDTAAVRLEGDAADGSVGSGNAATEGAPGGGTTAGGDATATPAPSSPGEAGAVEEPQAVPELGSESHSLIVGAPRATSGGPSPKADAYSAIARCYSSLTDQLPRDGRLVAAATGTYEGRAAIAMGFRTADGVRLLAVIVARDDCSIITAQSYR